MNKFDIAKKLGSDMFRLSVEGSVNNCWPISSAIASDIFAENLLKPLTEYLDKNIEHLHTFEARAYVVLFLNRKIERVIQKKYLSLLLSHLEAQCQDVTLQSSIELKQTDFDDDYKGFINDRSQYAKLCFLLGNYNEMLYPIFRGVGFEIFSYNGLLYRSYYCGQDTFTLISKYNKIPELSFFGHIYLPEEIDSFVILKNNTTVSPDSVLQELLVKLSAMNSQLRFNSVEESALYVLNRFRNHLGLGSLTKNQIDFKDIDFAFKINTKGLAQNKENVIKNTSKFIEELILEGD